MFTIIYEKETGKVVNITSASNAEELRAAIPNDLDFIFVDAIPSVTPFRQELVVKNGVLIVKSLMLTPEREREVRTYELNAQIEQLKMQLASWDYKTSKHADGDYTEAEWQEIVNQRKAWRAEINNLEKELELL